METDSTIQRRTLEHKIDVENEENKNRWRSCCLDVDRRAVQYFSQLAIIAGTMCFCIYQHIEIPSCEGQQAYIGLLTINFEISISGALLPARDGREISDGPMTLIVNPYTLQPKIVFILFHISKMMKRFGIMLTVPPGLL
jgi:hypothetical protein